MQYISQLYIVQVEKNCCTGKHKQSDIQFLYKRM